MNTKDHEQKLESIDHFAICVDDLQSTVDWYCKTFRCEVEYLDESWAFLKFANIKLAFVKPNQHPAHLAFVRTDAESFGALKTHRDGSKSTYIKDPSGNFVEVLAPQTMSKD